MKKLNYFFSSILIAALLFGSVGLFGQNPFYVNVLQPNDNVNTIEWLVGENHLISWDDNLSQPVDIYLVNTTLAIDVKLNTTGAISGGTWVWATPNTTYVEDANYQIRVESSVNGSTYNDTGEKFSLVQATTTPVTLLQPSVNNISWTIGTVHLISWSDNFNENVEIMLWDPNANAGAGAWSSLTGAAGVAGTTWEWTISGTLTASAGYKIKVRSVDFDNENDESDFTFTLTDASGDVYEVYQPNATSVWGMNTTHLISWRDDLTEAVNIYYKKSGGSQTLIMANVTGSTYLWTIPNTANFDGNYTIIVESSNDVNVEAVSASFVISETIGSISTIYQPSTTSSWTVGTTHLISWLDDLNETVNVYYTFDGGTTLNNVQLGVAGTTCYWTVPAGVTGTNACRIVVASSIDATVLKMSDAFDLTLSAGTTIAVLQPNVSGLSWAQNTSHLISWNDDFTEAVDIDLVWYNAGGVQQGTSSITTNVVGSTYIWSITGVATHDFCKIVISSTLDPSGLSDFSDNNFAITASAGTYVDVLDPDGGEYWMAGTSHLISWIDDLPENVTIELYDYAVPATPVKIAEAVSGLPDATTYAGGTMTWAIPQALTALSTYRIKITSTLDSDIYSFSGANFDIVPFGKSSSNNGFGDATVNVYPNPANGVVNIFSNANISNIIVQNMLGQVVYNSVATAQKTSIDITGFDSGMYVVNVTVDGSVITKKLFVQ